MLTMRSRRAGHGHEPRRKAFPERFLPVSGGREHGLGRSTGHLSLEKLESNDRRLLGRLDRLRCRADTSAQTFRRFIADEAAIGIINTRQRPVA